MVDIEITTQSGEHYVEQIENFNAVDLNDQINNREVITVVIGKRIFSRIDIKYVGPVE